MAEIINARTAEQMEAASAKKVRLTSGAFAAEVNRLGITVANNDITGAMEIRGNMPSGRQIAGLDDLNVLLYDTLADTYKGVTFDTLANFAGVLARDHSYNPVIDTLAAVEWDGCDRVEQLYGLIGISDDDRLSQQLVWKWLLQTVALLYNDTSKPFGADGVLVLNGDQGTGKTSLLRHLALRDAWFREGLSIDDKDKDTTRRAVTAWIVEFGELESTLRGDLERLKAFVTASTDKYRLPYGRADTETVRHASLAATCNTEQFLIDTTGNRRFWTVPFSRRTPYAEIKKLDALQLWAQIYAVVSPMAYDDKAACFRLTEQEQNALAERNGAAVKPIKAQTEVADILSQARDAGLVWQDMTVSAFKAAWPILTRYTAEQVGRALKQCGVEMKRKKNGRFYEVPTPTPPDKDVFI